jgi:hypothetical protein
MILFFIGASYVIIGLAVLIGIDLKTGRVDAFTRENDVLLFLMLFIWPLAFPVLFLPRYAPKNSKWTRRGG